MLPGVLDPAAVEAFESLRRRPRLRHQRLRAAPVRLLAGRPRLLAPVSVQVAEALALVAPRLERALVLGAGAFARGLVLAPAARVLMDAISPRLELDDPVHRPVEEGAVMGDHDETGVEAKKEALELLETCKRSEQRRLAAAVRADDADPATRTDRERDALEDRVGSAMNRYVVCGKRAALALHRGDLLTERQSTRLCAGISFVGQRS